LEDSDAPRFELPPDAEQSSSDPHYVQKLQEDLDTILTRYGMPMDPLFVQLNSRLMGLDVLVSVPSESLQSLEEAFRSFPGVKVRTQGTISTVGAHRSRLFGELYMYRFEGERGGEPQYVLSPTQLLPRGQGEVYSGTFNLEGYMLPHDQSRKRKGSSEPRESWEYGFALIVIESHRLD